MADEITTLPPAEAAPPPPTPAAPSAPGKGLAVASLVCSLVGLIPYVQVAAVVGIILGFVALNQMKGTAGEGRPLAKWGIIIGFVVVGLYVLCCVAMFIFYGGIVGLSALTGGMS
jgi:uncharacterized membrane protein